MSLSLLRLITMDRKYFIFLLTSIVFTITSSLFFYKKMFATEKKISTIMGDFHVREKIIIDAIANKSLERMKLVDQGGPCVYFGLAPSFPRYDHCLGVWALLRRFNASINEQLVGLWHDISHTAFSHVAEVVFNHKDENHSYQDKIHLWYLDNSSAHDLIEDYQLNLNDLDPDCGLYQMLEQPLPDMCADRIEYNLHTAFVYAIFTKEEIDSILNHLHYGPVKYQKNNEIIEENKWYFDEICSAKKFALLPLYFMQTIWATPDNVVFYKLFSQILKYAFEKKYITKSLFHFGTDQEILTILNQQKDTTLEEMLKNLHTAKRNFKVVNQNSDDYDEEIYAKFRGIDPLILQSGDQEAKRLTILDQNFCYAYLRMKEKTAKPAKIKYIKK